MNKKQQKNQKTKPLLILIIFFKNNNNDNRYLKKNYTKQKQIKNFSCNDVSDSIDTHVHKKNMKIELYKKKKRKKRRRLLHNIFQII